MKSIIGLYEHEKITLVFEDSVIYVYSVYGNFSFCKETGFIIYSPTHINSMFFQNEDGYGLLFYKIGKQTLLGLISKEQVYSSFDPFILPKGYGMEQFYYLSDFTDDLLILK